MAFLTDAPPPLAPVSLAKCNRTRVLFSTRRTGDPFCILQRSDPPPVMCWRLSMAVAGMGEGQKKIIGRAMLGTTAAPAFGDADRCVRSPSAPTGREHDTLVIPTSR
jgi:hypothetical protein